jgi:hypothetical protein
MKWFEETPSPSCNSQSEFAPVYSHKPHKKAR